MLRIKWHMQRQAAVPVPRDGADVQRHRDDLHAKSMQPTSVTRCHRSHLEARCLERGYTLDEVMPCVVAQDGDQWTIDVDHPAYPRRAKPGYATPTKSEPEPHGPGSELSMLLKRFGIEPTPTCACRAKAAEMDALGADECSRPERIEEVVAVMREEAKARGLPFVDMAGRLLVRRAIANARRKEAARATRPSLHLER